jgi:hypothetical protein
LTDKFDLTNVNNMVFYISGPKLLFETTEISTHPNSTQQGSNYIYLYTTKFGTSIKIRLNRKFESTEFETTRVNCIIDLSGKTKKLWSGQASLRRSRRSGRTNQTKTKCLPSFEGET